MIRLLSTVSELTVAAHSIPLQPFRTQDSLELIRLDAWQAFSKLRDEMASSPLAQWDTYA